MELAPHGIGQVDLGAAEVAGCDPGAVLADGQPTPALRAAEHHRIAVDDLGVRPAARVPLLIGGHGRRMVGLAARFADIFQFTGLVHGEDGTPTGAGFGLDHLDDAAAAASGWAVSTRSARATTRATWSMAVPVNASGRDINSGNSLNSSSASNLRHSAASTLGSLSSPYRPLEILLLMIRE